MESSRETAYPNRPSSRGIGKCDAVTVDTRTPSSVYTSRSLTTSRTLDSRMPYSGLRTVPSRDTEFQVRQEPEFVQVLRLPPGLTDQVLRLPPDLEPQFLSFPGVNFERSSLDGRWANGLTSFVPQKVAFRGSLDTASKPTSSNDEAWTTLMIRYLPSKFSSAMMLQEIRRRGFLYDIDFFYLPVDARRKRAAGYCFVNLTSPEAANKFHHSFDGTELHGVENSTICRITPGTVQGLLANIASYRKSSVAKLGVDFQPLIFENGQGLPLGALRNSSLMESETESLVSAVSTRSLASSTTLMLRGIPNKYNRNLLLEDFAERGVLMDIDFLYLPIDLRHQCSVGYCFINLTSKEAVDRFFNVFSGTTLQKVRSGKTCEVTIGRIQGQDANIDLYRNTSVMTMRDEYRPIILENGVRQAFPKPTISRDELLRCASQRTGVSCRFLK